MKKILIITGTILLIVITYLVCSVYYLNRDVEYYGVISDNNRVNKLVS